MAIRHTSNEVYSVLESPQLKQPPKIENGSDYIDGIPVSRLSVTGQIAVPHEIRMKLNLIPSNTVAFVVNYMGIVELRKARLKLELT